MATKKDETKTMTPEEYTNLIKGMLTESISQGDELLDLATDIEECFAIACDILNEKFPCEDDWYTVITREYQKAKKQNYS